MVKQVDPTVVVHYMEGRTVYRTGPMESPGRKPKGSETVVRIGLAP
jgi:hypothetical protein